MELTRELSPPESILAAPAPAAAMQPMFELVGREDLFRSPEKIDRLLATGAEVVFLMSETWCRTDEILLSRWAGRVQLLSVVSRVEDSPQLALRKIPAGLFSKFILAFVDYRRGGISEEQRWLMLLDLSASRPLAQLRTDASQRNDLSEHIGVLRDAEIWSLTDRDEAGRMAITPDPWVQRFLRQSERLWPRWMAVLLSTWSWPLRVALLYGVLAIYSLSSLVDRLTVGAIWSFRDSWARSRDEGSGPLAALCLSARAAAKQLVRHPLYTRSNSWLEQSYWQGYAATGHLRSAMWFTKAPGPWVREYAPPLYKPVEAWRAVKPHLWFTKAPGPWVREYFPLLYRPIEAWRKLLQHLRQHLWFFKAPGAWLRMYAPKLYTPILWWQRLRPHLWFREAPGPWVREYLPLLYRPVEAYRRLMPHLWFFEAPGAWLRMYAPRLYTPILWWQRLRPHLWFHEAPGAWLRMYAPKLYTPMLWWQRLRPHLWFHEAPVAWLDTYAPVLAKPFHWLEASQAHWWFFRQPIPYLMKYVPTLRPLWWLIGAPYYIVRDYLIRPLKESARD